MAVKHAVQSRAIRCYAGLAARLRLKLRQRAARFRLEPGIPAITNKTDKGLPRYCDGDESEVFILAGAEDLVPVLGPAGGQALRRDPIGLGDIIIPVIST